VRRNPDTRPLRFSFYVTSMYAESWMAESPTLVKRAWRKALEDGHEIGNHTRTHSPGADFESGTWEQELQLCNSLLVQPFNPSEVDALPDASSGIGMDPARIYGFRTPFLEYNDAMLQVLQSLRFRYDTSIEDGFQDGMDGTNYSWPYTLDNGSAGHEVLVGRGLEAPISPHAGLWELPVYPVIVPPDEKCEEYGVPRGMRARMKALQSWFDEGTGKITGFDYNLWVTFNMTKAEFLATLKYTLDQRLAGNRAPFLFGAHTDVYSPKYTEAPGTSTEERQHAVEEFLDWARSKPEVYVVSYKQVLDWVRNPRTLDEL
jgi:hypothetical protein